MNNYENLIGTKLDNRYELLNIVGTGGMAIVYEAVDISMNRTVAIKMLKSEIQENEQDVKRFINESKVVAMLSHPNIVHIYDVSVKNTDRMYIVMEYIDGITLKDYINGKGKLQWREAIIYTEQILNALQHAHAKGVVHRDVKPQNIILLRNGNIKVTDFGIAKLPNSEPLTMLDKAIGTVHYISPEQASGEGKVTARSDIYSVGIMLYEMTTGNLPFMGNTAIQIAMMQVNDPPQNPRSLNPEIPKGLSQIILKAMDKSQEERYKTAAEMVKHLALLSANPATIFSNTQQKMPVPIDKSLSDKKKETGIQRVNKDIKESKKPHRRSENDMRRNGKTKKRNVRKSKSFLPIVSGVTLAFLIVLGISGYNILLTLISGVEAKGENIEIQNYVGRLYNEDLKAELANTYNVKVTYVHNDVMGENQIVTQIPEGGDIKKISTAKDKIDITFTVSKGKDSFELPDVSFYPYREMEIYLAELQLKVAPVEYENHDSIITGFVIRTDPEAGTVVNAGDEIKIIVSKGQTIKKILMPDLKGKTEREAKRILVENNLILKEIKYEYSDFAEGTVIGQDIIAFKEVPEKSTKVTLTVSNGSRFTPPTTQKPTETQPPSTTEPTTEKVTEKITEPITEKPTEKPTEKSTTEPTSKATEPTTKKEEPTTQEKITETEPEISNEHDENDEESEENEENKDVTKEYVEETISEE